MRASSVLSVPPEGVSGEPIVPFVPIVPASGQDDEGWPEPVPSVDLDRVLELDWDELGGLDLRDLFR